MESREPRVGGHTVLYQIAAAGGLEGITAAVLRDPMRLPSAVGIDFRRLPSCVREASPSFNRINGTHGVTCRLPISEGAAARSPRYTMAIRYRRTERQN